MESVLIPFPFFDPQVLHQACHTTPLLVNNTSSFTKGKGLIHWTSCKPPCPSSSKHIPYLTTLMILHALNRMLPTNQTQVPQPSPTFHTSSSPIGSLSSQQDSQWGASGIGTVVFGCVASILGILALWMMFWTRQRDSGHSEISGMGSTFHL